MSVLNQLSSWPVDNAAGAIVTDDGVVAAHGDVSRVYELASVTKLLVARAVLVAVEEEAVDLTTPAGPPGATVAHLLAHASGLAFDSPRAQTAPERERIYSSAGYEALADLVAAETGIEFADYLAEAVCEPLGMTSTVLAGPAGHGARSSVADLARFAGELLSSTLLSGATATAARTVQFPGLDGFVPGYGRFRPNDWAWDPRSRAPRRDTGPPSRTRRRRSGTSDRRAPSYGWTRCAGPRPSFSPIARSVRGPSRCGVSSIRAYWMKSTRDV